MVHQLTVYQTIPFPEINASSAARGLSCTIALLWLWREIPFWCRPLHMKQISCQTILPLIVGSSVWCACNRALSHTRLTFPACVSEPKPALDASFTILFVICLPFDDTSVRTAFFIQLKHVLFMWPANQSVIISTRCFKSCTIRVNSVSPLKLSRIPAIKIMIRDLLGLIWDLISGNWVVRLPLWRHHQKQQWFLLP